MALEPWLRGYGRDRPLRFLDIGTGIADIPMELSRRARRADLNLNILATDVRPEIVDAASDAASVLTSATGDSGIRVAIASSDRIDQPDRSFDVVHASLVLHHLDPAPATALLGEMARVASRAVIVNDLNRRLVWWVGAWLLSHVATANRYTRHDAPLSVRRAYLSDEVTEMAHSVGLRKIARYRTWPRYRYALVFVVPPAPNA
jgi:ubiquinone/menaquinone biosynthesis C-methylase UbiE